MEVTSKLIKVGKRGVITLPRDLRDQHDIAPGDHLRLLDLDGVLVLTDRADEVDQLSDRIREELEEREESLSSMLEALREKREAYGEDA